MNRSFFSSINYFKIVSYLVVLFGFNITYAGSFEDFFSAIKQDDVVQVQALLQRGFDPNTLDSTGQPGLIAAIKSGSVKVATLLVNTPNIKVEVRNSADESPLMMAALNGHVALVRLLIQKDADVNKPGWTALHYAATNGHIDVMDLLLEENAYIDATSPNGTTPLMMAAHYGTPSAVKQLLEAGADPVLKNDQGLNAFDFANRAARTESANIISAFVRGRQPKGVW